MPTTWRSVVCVLYTHVCTHIHYNHNVDTHSWEHQRCSVCIYTCAVSTRANTLRCSNHGRQVYQPTHIYMHMYQQIKCVSCTIKVLGFHIADSESRRMYKSYESNIASQLEKIFELLASLVPEFRQHIAQQARNTCNTRTLVSPQLGPMFVYYSMCTCIDMHLTTQWLHC